jgi:hypothetical protein
MNNLSGANEHRHVHSIRVEISKEHVYTFINYMRYGPAVHRVRWTQSPRQVGSHNVLSTRRRRFNYRTAIIEYALRN